MPNGWEPSSQDLTWSITVHLPIRFGYMFHLDAAGKCRLNYDDTEWRIIVAVQRKDWRTRLEKLLMTTGTPQDWENAKEFLRDD